MSNAAQNVAGSVLDTDPAAFEEVIGVNVNGTHRVVSALVPAMAERTRGDVVFVTSDVVVRPRPSMAAYVTSKWGLEGYVRSLQMELEGTGVRATIVRPGPTQTGMGMDWDPGGHRRGHRAVGRVGIRPALQLHAPWPEWPRPSSPRSVPPRGTHATRRRATAGSADQCRDPKEKESP